MSIERISRIKGHKVFRDFSWPSDLTEFKRYNLIYGWNGTGKSTLARLFRHLQQRTPITEGTVSFQIGGQQIEGTAIDAVTCDVRVFTADFIAENVFTAANQLSPIYVIGKENVDRQARLSKLRELYTDYEDERRRLRAQLQDANNAVDDFCTTQARIIKEALGAHGNRYANYNRRNFRDKIEEALAPNAPALAVLNDHEKQRLLAQARMLPKPRIEQQLYSLPDFPSLAQQVSALLRRSVASTVIESLKKSPAVSEWVHHGLTVHGTAPERCIFCDQPLPPGRIDDLNAHFSREFAQLLEEIELLTKTLQTLASAAREFKPPKVAEFYDDLVADYWTTLKGIAELCRAAANTLDGMITSLDKKRSAAFDVIVADTPVPNLDAEPLSLLHGMVRAHNDTCAQFDARILAALSQLEHDFIARALDEYKQLRENCSAAHTRLTTIEVELASCTREKQTLEREIISHREPADELNRELRAYLGHDDLQLEVKETGYTITRKGQPASGMSEGEQTAIALLYFLKTLRGRDFDMLRGIVVLDDPVSSLDANAMFNAFAYIKDHTCDAHQVFLLTHNFGFFRAVRQWFNNLQKPTKHQARMFMLLAKPDDSGRSAFLGEMDPLLRKHESEYHYLFAYIWRLAQAPVVANLAEYLPAPMVARRVLESFLAFRVPDEASLYSRMRAIPCEDTVRSRVYRFVNTHAHKDGIGDLDDDLTILSETKAVLQSLIEFMRTADPEHCRRMIQCVASPSTEVGN